MFSHGSILKDFPHSPYHLNTNHGQKAQVTKQRIQRIIAIKTLVLTERLHCRRQRLCALYEKVSHLIQKATLGWSQNYPLSFQMRKLGHGEVFKKKIIKGQTGCGVAGSQPGSFPP